MIDRVGAGLLLAVMAPLFLMIAAAIRLDSRGPLLFRQERSGRLGRRFTMFKFRTMVSDAELRKHALLHLNIHETGSPDFKLRDDPRITRVGRFLRKTSLDELPNLINVLRGDMSLVGPRPTSFDASTYQPHQLARLAATPGITGVWQVSGRANVDFETRAAMDIEYINRASLGYDLRILLVTPFKMHAGAY